MRKRDFLLEVEHEIQAKWAEEHQFESDAPLDPHQAKRQPKYFANFPYPYMNGKLHLGHGFTLLKADFQANFQRLIGKRVIFPFAFHGTGMPIQASANRLAEEIRDYGCPPKFPTELSEKAETPTDSSAPETGAPKGKSRKSKLTAKTGSAIHQWQIMLSSGVDPSEIPKFAEANYWLEYFPSHAKADLQSLGCGIDFRRSFLTTEINPYYDSFVQWQYRQLQKKGHLKFGKRESIYSPKDGQICADHDRSVGEGVVPQEYTLIRLTVCLVDTEQSAFPELVEYWEQGTRIVLLAATLRPETMFGQTNAWILPEGEYGCYQIDRFPNEVFIMGAQAARNLSYQGYGGSGGSGGSSGEAPIGQVNCLKTVSGQSLIGLGLLAPFCTYQRIYLLPMESISMTKGTGIVTSVPSDAPHDYLNLKVLQEKEAYRQKLGLRDEWVLPYQPQSILTTSEFGELSAQAACEKYKIQSPKEHVKLNQAKDEVYRAGYHDGVFLVGGEGIVGQAVSEVKGILKAKLLTEGLALPYWEPTSQVISRSGDECVVALTDQWYLDYSNEEWKKAVVNYVESELECYGSELKDLLLFYVKWMKQWGCSRSFGLGTKLPQDPKYLVESLSDSTIYMAFYTIAHLLLDPETNLQVDPTQLKPGPAGITVEMIQDPELSEMIWNYVFSDGQLDVDLVAKWQLSVGNLARLHQEFRYWYPWDLRVSGRDLAYNHLPFSLYHHCALFPKKFWPRSIKCGGFLQINKEKMSKSKGNFLTLAEAIEKYSASGVRLTLADSGDGLEFANFMEVEANKMILRLYNECEWMETIMKKEKDKPAYQEDTTLRLSTKMIEFIFSHQIRQAIVETEHHYQALEYHQVLKSGFFELQNARDRYLLWVGEDQIDRELIIWFIEVQALLMAPIVPQWSEYIWRKILKHPRSIFCDDPAAEGITGPGGWPECEPPNPNILQQGDYLAENCHRFHQKREYFQKKQLQSPTSAVISVSETYAEWQVAVVEIMQHVYTQPENHRAPAKALKGQLIKEYAKHPQLKPQLGKKAKLPLMPFSAQLQEECEKVGPKQALNLRSSFGEYQVWTSCQELVRQQLKVEELTIRKSDDPNDGRQGQPGKPVIQFS